MVSRTFHSLIFATLTLATAWGQDADPANEPPQPEVEVDPFARFSWQTEGVGEISSHATIQIPEGYRFLNGRETAEVMEMVGNLPDQYDGMIGPEGLEWFVLFQFEDSGYVKDDEKDELDADVMLEALREGEEASNEERKRLGYDTLTTVGWAVEPKFNDSTKNLEWGIILQSSDGGKNVNYLTKLLGRHGIMHTTLVCDNDQLETILPTYQNLITDFEYNSGNTYAEYQEGDKVSNMGLKALVAGGAIFAAAKLGLFAKLMLFFKKGLKVIVIGAIAIGAFLKRIITGKKADA
ncbi:DUF2167 domain-containing protein [Verrucomicrobiaceae bacterium 227]